jgi:hypothetical protein
MIDNWQPNIKDKTSNAFAMLDVFEDDILRQINFQRERIQLPIIEK